MSALRCVPVELRAANAFVDRHHRHHRPVVSHRFSIGVVDASGVLRGVAICGRPVARGCDPATTLEVTRCCTDGTPHVASKAYAAAARAAAAIGYLRVQTYTLAEEPGTSLRAAGWVREADVAGRQWHHTDDGQGRLFQSVNRRTDQPTGDKARWAKMLHAARGVPSLPRAP